jgi:hypothetical protein
MRSTPIFHFTHPVSRTLHTTGIIQQLHKPTWMEGKSGTQEDSSLAGAVPSVRLSLLPTECRPVIAHTDYMAYTRASSEDYDRFARVTKDDGWKWKNLLPYIYKVRQKSSRSVRPNRRDALLVMGRTKTFPHQPIIMIPPVSMTPVCTAHPA